VCILLSTVLSVKYLIELRNSSPASDPLEFWEQRMHVYPRLAPLAQDLISAPASQAFAFFSL